MISIFICQWNTLGYFYKPLKLFYCQQFSNSKNSYYHSCLYQTPQLYYNGGYYLVFLNGGYYLFLFYNGGYYLFLFYNGGYYLLFFNGGYYLLFFNGGYYLLFLFYNEGYYLLFLNGGYYLLFILFSWWVKNIDLSPCLSNASSDLH